MWTDAHWLDNDEKRLKMVEEIVFRMLTDDCFKHTPFERMLEIDNTCETKLSVADKATADVITNKLSLLTIQTEKELFGKSENLLDKKKWEDFYISVLKTFAHTKKSLELEK